MHRYLQYTPWNLEIGKPILHWEINAGLTFLRAGSTSQLVCWSQPWLSAIGVYWNQVELIETSFFTRQISELLDDEEYRRFQAELAANPAAGALIRGGGGIRKVRVAVGSRGKSSGARVIYYWAVRKDLILLLFVFPKNVAANLSARQTAQLAKAVKEEFGDE